MSANKHDAYCLRRKAEMDAPFLCTCGLTDEQIAKAELACLCLLRNAGECPLHGFAAIRGALAELVRLKDGPRDDAYRAAKDAAWDAARKALDA